MKDYLYITGLAFRDISHERILSLCMACSLGAIFTPIIILLGLQQGIIGNMLDTLDSDPASRLVRPKFMSQSPLPKEDLLGISQAGVEFIPSETSHLLIDIKGLSDSVNAVPSSMRDPFYLKSEPVATGAEAVWVVISEPMSKALGKQRLDTLTVLLRRTTQSGFPEEVPFDFKIAGILNTEMMPDMKIYLPVETFNGIYHWRKGYAAPELGLKGNRETNFSPEYDGVITTFVSKSPEEKDFRKMLAGRFPFSSMPIAYEDLFVNQSSIETLLWQTVNSTISEVDVEVLRNTLLNYGYAPELVPYVKDIDLELSGGGDKSWRVALLSQRLSPDWHDDQVPVLYVSNEDKSYIGNQNVILTTGIENNTAIVPVELKISEHVPAGFIAANHYFAGLLRSAVRAGAIYDPARYSFALNSKEQVRYFRVYSSSIDQLQHLVEAVKRVGDSLGLNALREPVSRLYEVQKIRTLSNYMERIYLLIATISGVSTIFAVSASVYATVQRRRKDLAYLNMLGVNKATIIFFPFIKSMILISIGLLIAFSAYWLFGVLASHWFVDLLGETESLTRLDPLYAFSLITIILSLGGLSSLLAGGVVSKIDSKRYIHE